MAPLAPTLSLSSGYAMPLLGLGLWKIPKPIAAETVYQAIKAGYRLLDGASDYGNEVECGQGVARAIKDGLVKREELFIVSKLWNTYHREDVVEKACRRSLADWGLDYFDLYFIHMPIALKYVDFDTRYPPGWSYDGTPDGKLEIEPSPMYKTWAAMESLVEKKLVRSLGVSSFGGGLLMDLLTYAKIRPAVTQVEMHPYLVQPDLLNMCAAFDIKVMAFCSFGPQSWIELSSPRVALVGSLFDSPPVLAAAKAHSVSTAQVLLRWATQRNVIAIPKSTKVERLEENLLSCTFDLSSDELDAITALDQDFRFANPAAVDPRISMFA